MCMSVKRVNSKDKKSNKSDCTNHTIIQEESSNTVYTRLCSNNTTHETICETQDVNDQFCNMITIMEILDLDIVRMLKD